YKDMLFHHLYRELILLPMFWVLRNKFNKFLIHASAITDNDQTYVFLGNDGVGKTTIALNLLKKEGVKFFVDNFLLYDYVRIYSFVDQLRVNNSDVEEINFYNKSPLFSKVISETSRTHFNFTKNLVAEANKPTKFFLLKQSYINSKKIICEEEFIN